MRAIELFCGIGGFRVACDKLGMETVFANDLAEKPAKMYARAFGDEVLRIGDIRTLKTEVPEHDVLTGGFPCQPFSSAGKKKGTEDPRGTLFMEIADILEAKKPRHFFLENVPRLLLMDNGRHFATILSVLGERGYSMEWRVLDARETGLSQARRRVIICGERGARQMKGKLGGGARAEDLGNLSDINKGFPAWGMSDGLKVWGGAPNREDFSAPPMSSILESEWDTKMDLTESTIERLKVSDEVNKFIDGVKVLANQRGGARMGYTVFGTDGAAPTLTASTSRHYERYKMSDGRYRRLTPLEYERLQGFPDGHTVGLSEKDRYVALGNAVPPPMVEWVMRRWFEK